MTFSGLSLSFGRQRSVWKAGAHRWSSTTAPIYPRAAVAATIQWTSNKTQQHHYLLVQRKNPPDAGKWSPAGGKILLGESTLGAAKREVQEETGLVNCRWHSNSFLTTDAIIEGENNSDSSYAFHYVIAHCFARMPVSSEAPLVVPSDDALDAKWYTLRDLRDLDCSEFTVQVLERAEELSDAGLLPV